MNKSKELLKLVEQGSSGWRIEYDYSRQAGPYKCAAWWCEHGPWWIGYGETVDEAIKECLNKMAIDNL